VCVWNDSIIVNINKPSSLLSDIKKKVYILSYLVGPTAAKSKLMLAQQLNWKILEVSEVVETNEKRPRQHLQVHISNHKQCMRYWNNF